MTKTQLSLGAILGLTSFGWLLFAGDEDQDKAPIRARLFDTIVWKNTSSESLEDASPSKTETFDFDGDDKRSDGFWLAKNSTRSHDFFKGMGNSLARSSQKGREGGALQLGPGLRDLSYAVILLEAAPLTRFRISARVKLENHPMGSEASTREAMRIVEHNRRDVDPKENNWRRTRRRPLGVSRRIDPSGWDRVEAEFVTQSETQSLELRLLHRSGDDLMAATYFDDLTIEEFPVPKDELFSQLASRYRPNDGREDETPWRVRVPLSVADDYRIEYRDSVLVPVDEFQDFEVTIPEESTAPRLRFNYGSLPETFGIEGDGVLISVSFIDETESVTSLQTILLDAKNRSDHRTWQEALIDLSPWGSKAGRIRFAVRDIGGSSADLLDCALIATPRIEPMNEVPEALNVLLIGVDTLRADRMSAFGYSKDTTPNLKALLKEGTAFPKTRSQAPWTLPSFSSILTSLYPSSHGAGRGGHDEWTPIDPTTTALPEILSLYGYETQGITANHLISPRYGLDQGFEAYRVPGNRGRTMESVDVDSEGVLEFLEARRNAPFFLFWHIMDPHLPYDTASKFRDEFVDTDYSGQFSKRGGTVPFQSLDPRPGRRWFAHEGPPPPPTLSEEDRRYVHDYYDAEIAEMDAGVGRVFEGLKERGLWDRTIIAFIADHGEGLGDHNHYHHGYTLYDDQVHIPMIIRIPGKHEGEVISRPVAAIDLAPTLLGALGLSKPEFFEGVDRLASDAPDDDPIVIEYPTYDSSAMKAYIQGPFKYMQDPVFRVEKLFDTDADPGEQNDLLESDGEFSDFLEGARSHLDQFRWTAMQKGRFHFQVMGEPGQRLALRVETDGLFDANFATLPRISDDQFQMDLDRQELVIDTELTRGRMTLVFWCRGSNVTLSAELDGKPLEEGLVLGQESNAIATPASLDRDRIPVLKEDEVPSAKRFQGQLWLAGGAMQLLPVVSTPEEIELLRRLGYAR